MNLEAHCKQLKTQHQKPCRPSLTLCTQSKFLKSLVHHQKYACKAVRNHHRASACRSTKLTNKYIHIDSSRLWQQNRHQSRPVKQRLADLWQIIPWLLLLCLQSFIFSIWSAKEPFLNTVEDCRLPLLAFDAHAEKAEAVKLKLHFV